MQFQANGFCSIRGCISLPMHFGWLLNQLCNRRHLKSHLHRLLGTNGKKIKQAGQKTSLTAHYVRSQTLAYLVWGFQQRELLLVNTAFSTSASFRLLTLNRRAITFQPRAAKCSCAYKTQLFFLHEPGWHFRCPYMSSAEYIHLGTSHSRSQRINLSTSGAIKAKSHKRARIAIAA